MTFDRHDWLRVIFAIFLDILDLKVKAAGIKGDSVIGDSINDELLLVFYSNSLHIDMQQSIASKTARIFHTQTVRLTPPAK